MGKVAVLLPAYNEELTIGDTIRDFYVQLPEALFVVVNNASTDRTREVVLKTYEELSIEGLLIDEARPGKGNAVRRGLKSVSADAYVIADADMTYPAQHVHELIAPVLDRSADMVVGDRLSGGVYKSENKRKFHNFGNSLVCWLVNRIFRAGLKDIMSGYRVLSREFVEHYPILVEGFQIETDMTLHALDKRFRIVEVPIEYRDRPQGSSSKLNTFADGSRVLLTIVTIFRHYRPLMFFGFLAAIFVASSLLVGAPVLHDWVVHRYIYHVPSAILASGLALIAVILFVLGLILDTIAYQYRLNFERDLNPDKADNQHGGRKKP